MARSRAWEARHEEQADISEADNRGLQNAGKIFTHSSVEDLSTDVGGNRQLAILLLQGQGKEVTKTSINSQMRSIQRWQKRERGEGGQTTKPNQHMQDLLRGITIDQKLKGDKKTQVSVKGPSSVNGYKRDNRDAEIWLDSENARDFFEALSGNDMDAAWDILAGAYGVSEFHAYDGAAIDIN